MRYLQATPSTAKVKLDIKDRKILSMLSANARIPLTLLSRKVGLSRDAVNYRIRNYEKNGIIQGYRTMVDMSRLGYESVHMFMRLKNPSKDAEQKMLGKLIKHPAVRAIIKFSGNYDFEIAFVTKGIEDLDRTLTEIISCCSESLQDYELLTISKTFAAETFPKSFLDQKAEINIKKRTAGKADKKDLDILKIIGEDAALPLYKIASKVGLSADAVSYRIKNMVSSGVIVKFIPVINYASIGYSLHIVLLNINGLDEEKEKSLRGFLLSDKNVLWAVKTVGRFNLLAYLLVDNIESLQKTILGLRSLFPDQISHYDTLIAYEEYKYIYFPKGLF